jgi:hypothetical protein
MEIPSEPLLHTLKVTNITAVRSFKVRPIICHTDGICLANNGKYEHRWTKKAKTQDYLYRP